MVPLSAVIRSVPVDVPIEFVKTDMQGYDLIAVKEGISELAKRAVPYVKTEVNFDTTASSYARVSNGICDGWLPLMKSHGYTLVMLKRKSLAVRRPEGYGSHDDAEYTCRHQNITNGSSSITNKSEDSNNLHKYEADALWKLSELETPDVSRYDYPTVQEVLEKKAFGTEDYEKCG